jgi:hypothetical protein
MTPVVLGVDDLSAQKSSPAPRSVARVVDYLSLSADRSRLFSGANHCQPSPGTETSRINRSHTRTMWGGRGSNPRPTDYESPHQRSRDQAKRLAGTAQIACNTVQLTVTGTIPVRLGYGCKPPLVAGGNAGGSRAGAVLTAPARRRLVAEVQSCARLVGTTAYFGNGAMGPHARPPHPAGCAASPPAGLKSPVTIAFPPSVAGCWPA